MSYFLVYAAHRFVFRVVDFFHHWYIDAPRAMVRRLASAFARLHLPLAARVLVGGAIATCFLLFFIAWLALPLAILFFVINNLPKK